MLQLKRDRCPKSNLGYPKSDLQVLDIGYPKPNQYPKLTQVGLVHGPLTKLTVLVWDMVGFGTLRSPKLDHVPNLTWDIRDIPNRNSDLGHRSCLGYNIFKRLSIFDMHQM